MMWTASGYRRAGSLHEKCRGDLPDRRSDARANQTSDGPKACSIDHASAVRWPDEYRSSTRGHGLQTRPLRKEEAGVEPHSDLRTSAWARAHARGWGWHWELVMRTTSGDCRTRRKLIDSSPKPDRRLPTEIALRRHHGRPTQIDEPKTSPSSRELLDRGGWRHNRRQATSPAATERQRGRRPFIGCRRRP